MALMANGADGEGSLIKDRVLNISTFERQCSDKSLISIKLQAER